MKSIVKDANGILYCNLFNYNNSVCPLIATIQKLHSSKTLNFLLGYTDVPYNDLLYPLKVYMKLDEYNCVKIYNEIRDWFTYAYDKLFCDPAKIGEYDIDDLLRHYYLPIIYKLCVIHLIDFKKIINELNVKLIMYCNMTEDPKNLENPILN